MRLPLGRTQNVLNVHILYISANVISFFVFLRFTFDLQSNVSNICVSNGITSPLRIIFKLIFTSVVQEIFGRQNYISKIMMSQSETQSQS